jgi:Predicted periplasmic lipoprotein (DUF2279)
VTVKSLNASIASVVFTLLIFSPCSIYADVLSDGCYDEISAQEKSSRLWTTNLTGIGVITAWGVTNWDYFSGSPSSSSEGWFGNDTESGGADKLGHAYTSYVLTHGLSSLYAYWCFNKKDAALYGAVSSFAIVGYIELGDAFSDFGASKEDMIANVIGIAFGFMTYSNQELSDILDFRWEYMPNDETLNDFTTDYENSKYLLALKLNGFDFARSSFLKHIEIHAGYYTRGFAEQGAMKERNVFIGLGFNLTDLFRRHSYNKTSTLFKYYQIPNTSIRVTEDLND